MRFATFDGRVEFCNLARAEQGLVRYHLAGLAISNVAEVGAVVRSTGQLLVAVDDAHVAAFRVSCSTQFLLYGATQFLAFVIFATFQYVANLLALEVLYFINILLRHQLFQFINRIIHLVAGTRHLRLPTAARHLHHLFTEHAAVVVAGFGALVEATGQELIAGCAADGDRLDTGGAIFAEEFFDWVAAARAELDAFGVFLARLALP